MKPVAHLAETRIGRITEHLTPMILDLGERRFTLSDAMALFDGWSPFGDDAQDDEYEFLEEILEHMSQVNEGEEFAGDHFHYLDRFFGSLIPLGEDETGQMMFIAKDSARWEDVREFCSNRERLKIAL